MMINLCKNRATTWMLTSAASTAAVVTLLLAPDRVIGWVHLVLDRVLWGDLIGHAALMGGLTAVLYAGMRFGFRRRFSQSLALAIFATLAISAITEAMQLFMEGRTPDRADFTANLLGIFITTSAICYQRLRVMFHNETI